MTILYVDEGECIMAIVRVLIATVAIGLLVYYGYLLLKGEKQ